MTVIFDFTRIASIDDFYKIAKSEMQLPDYFGNNLDALWDEVTAGIELPATIEFKNMSLLQLEKFESLISLFEEAHDELGDDFTFSYFVRNSF